MLTNLTPAQRGVIAFHNGAGVPVQWFVGTERDSGAVEIIGLGDGFIWSLLIEANGDYSSSEAKVGEFSTGIDL